MLTAWLVELFWVEDEGSGAGGSVLIEALGV